MATEVVMPKLGLTMETGTIGSWLVEEGAPVTKGQPLLEIITDKVTMDVEAQVDGVLLKMLHAAFCICHVTTVWTPLRSIVSTHMFAHGWACSRMCISVV